MTSRWPPLEGVAGARADDTRTTPTPTPAAPTPTPTPTPPIEIGNVIAGKYRVERVIGFGGMGIVCAATHLELGTPCAIKFVRPERASDERAAARFLTEARAAAQLQSQFACRVMDCGRLPTGNPYIVMEYLSGQDLRKLVDTRGPLDIEEAVLLALHACEALAEAHSKHIVHRDVKPENLFVAEGPGGAPLLKVLDFGISKQVTPLTVQRAVTDSSESMGSPFHMSPEQMLEPASVDSRSDIWSLGVVLYEVLTGHLPFAGQTAPQLCANVMTTHPISPQAHRPDIPEGLSRVILKCLEKDREQRFRDVGELSLSLKDFAGPAGAVAAAHVEKILGRTPSNEPPRVEAPAVEAQSIEEQAVESLRRSGAIPGIPKHSLGLRVGVGIVLVAAALLAVFAVRRAASPRPVEPAPQPGPLTAPAPAPATLAPAPTVSPAPAPSGLSAAEAQPSAVPSATAKRLRRAPRVAAPTAAPAAPMEPPAAAPVEPPPAPVEPPAAEPAEPPPAPVEAPPAQSSSVVYPSLTPIPDMPPP